ncbi:MAG: M1 family metallopeptidase [Bacteroidetes bacterium]|nr:M1 family metallopeptidase [Bacteroidota bacterium]
MYYTLRRSLAFYIFMAMFFSSFTLFSQDDKKIYTHLDTLRGSLNPARMYDVKFYDLRVKVFPETKSILGVNEIYFIPDKDMDSMQIDLFANYEIQMISYKQTKPLYRRQGNHIFVRFTQKPKKGELTSIKILYEGKPIEAKKAPWDGGFVWTTDSLGKPWIAVACEGVGASSWWPCKDYLGDEPDSMRITAQVPKALTCISNGSLITARNVEYGYAEFVYYVHYPINTYNVTLNIGDYKHIQDNYRSISGELMDVDYYALRYHEKKAKEYFPPQVKDMLKQFEKYFGPYPCPKDGYGLVETPYYGMEHQCAIAYGNNFKNESHGQPFDFIIVHESGHEWWGNSLSCSDEAEMWLHESFTTYAEALYVEGKFGYEKSLDYLNEEKVFIKNATPMIGKKGVNDYTRADNDIYYKGAWMLHTLRNVIHNDEIWLRIIYDFAAQNKHKIISTQDFISFVNKRTAKDFTPFFNQYLNYPNLPLLEYNYIDKGNSCELEYRWRTDVPTFTMPIYIDAPSGGKQLLTPTTQWQKIKLKGAAPKSLHMPESMYLIDVMPRYPVIKEPMR